jgi:hypothetical protein
MDPPVWLAMIAAALLTAQKVCLNLIGMCGDSVTWLRCSDCGALIGVLTYRIWWFRADFGDLIRYFDSQMLKMLILRTIWPNFLINKLFLNLQEHILERLSVRLELTQQVHMSAGTAEELRVRFQHVFTYFPHVFLTLC